MSHILLNIDAESLIRYGGLTLLCVLVFCSVGLFIFFFFPIGGVLFAVGIIAATKNLLPPLLTVCLLLTLSSIAGSLAGYGIGRSTGKFLYTRPESRFFRRSYLTATEDFYKKYGLLAIPAGYFLPVIRTFAPILSGIIKMEFRKFLLLSIIGSAIFISAFVFLGYLIGSLPFLQPWLKYIITAFVLIITVPLIVKIIKTMRAPIEK